MKSLFSITGREIAALGSFDEVMETYMRARGVPRGTLGVAKDGRLVFARGYTFATDSTTPTIPDALFRIASISKPLTAVAILQLVERNRVGLDQPFSDFVDVSGSDDPRVFRVTIRQLLQHRGGYDRAASLDPMVQDARIRDTLGVRLPTTVWDIIEFMKRFPLDADPGERYAYSNYGYLLLGRVIEAASGEGYESYVKTHVLAPLGITRTQLGDALYANRRAGEVDYSDPTGRMYPSVFGAERPGMVRQPYGSENLRAMDAHGGWISSTMDLLRFARAFDDPSHCPTLSAESIHAMWSPYPSPEPPGDAFYGLGWMVRPLPDKGDRNTWHGGSMPGTSTLVVRRWDGLSWAALFNQRSEDTPGLPPSGEIDSMLHDAANRVTDWHNGDSFAEWQ
ncbi:beta-lactamase family protein [Candidatus Poribacteria bacterium]|nr:beta-lactamase family protein [Candidatus Poribacteria bacterium]